MSNLHRNVIAELDDDELLQLWTEADEYDRVGSVDGGILGRLRDNTRAGVYTNGLEVMPALWLNTFIAECWRAVAVRGLTPPGTDRQAKTAPSPQD